MCRVDAYIDPTAARRLCSNSQVVQECPEKGTLTRHGPMRTSASAKWHYSKAKPR